MFKEKQMKGKVRSAMGEMIDMAALASRNSHVVALGNAGMNARGDIVDRQGNVLKSRDVIVQEYYNSSPKRVTQTVSLKDLGDEILTPAQVIEKLEGKLEDKKPAAKKRKIVEDDDQ
jgi:hypothetical protein